MALSILGLVDQVSGEMGLSQPSAVVGSSVNQTAQFLALANALGQDLVAEYEWNQLTKQYIWQTKAAVVQTGTTTSGSTAVTGLTDTSLLPLTPIITGTGIAPYTELIGLTSSTAIVMSQPATASGTVSISFAYQDYALPSDHDRMISDSNWDRTNHWRNLGPKSSQEWQTLQGGLISTGPRERFRIYAGKLRIFPAVASVYNMSYEYVSNSWVIAFGNTTATKSSFTADTDTAIFPDNLMRAGLKYYFLRAKKLDFGVEMAAFNDILSIRKAQDQPVGAASLAPQPISPLISPWSVPEGSWNL